MTRFGTATTTGRTVRVALVAGALAAGLAGCGSDDDGATTAASRATTTATAPATTTRADGGRTATATDVTPQGTATGTTPTTATVTEATPATTSPAPSTATTPTTATTATTAKAAQAPTRDAGSAADRTAVRATVARYMRAFVTGDGKTVCALLSDRQRTLLGSRGAGSCEQATRTAQAAVAKSPAVRRSLESLRVGAVSVSGDRAVGAAKVAANGRSTTFPIQIERTADGWRISSNSPAGG